MKTYTNIKFIPIIALSIIALLPACENYKVEKPVIYSFSKVQDTVRVGGIVKFKFEAKAENFVIWTGDPRHDYYGKLKEAEELAKIPLDSNYRYNPKNKGVQVDSILNYTYIQNGQYVAVLVATNVEPFSGEIKQTISELQVTVLPKE